MQERWPYQSQARRSGERLVHEQLQHQFKRAEAELNDQSEKLPESDRAIMLRTEVGEARVVLAKPLVELSRQLCSVTVVDSAIGAIRKADEELDQWDKKHVLDHDTLHRETILPFGVSVRLPREFEGSTE